MMLLSLTQNANEEIPREMRAAAKRIGGHIERSGGVTAQVLGSWAHYELEIEKRATVGIQCWDDTEDEWIDARQIDVVWFQGRPWRYYDMSTSRSGWGELALVPDEQGRHWEWRTYDGARIPMLPLDSQNPVVFATSTRGEAWVINTGLKLSPEQIASRPYPPRHNWSLEFRAPLSGLDWGADKKARAIELAARIEKARQR
jgi:hypothetical protein